MDSKKVVAALNGALQMELQTAIRNLHYSFQVLGPSRKPVVEFFRQEATESIGHAATLGEKILALGGQPTINVQAFHKATEQSVEALLADSLKHDEEAVRAYTDLLKLVQDDVPLRVLVENQILSEQEHVEELRKFLRAPRT